MFMIEHESRLPDKGIFQDRSVEKWPSANSFFCLKTNNDQLIKEWTV